MPVHSLAFCFALLGLPNVLTRFFALSFLPFSLSLSLSLKPDPSAQSKASNNRSPFKLCKKKLYKKLHKKIYKKIVNTSSSSAVCNLQPVRLTVQPKPFRSDSIAADTLATIVDSALLRLVSGGFCPKRSDMPVSYS